MNGRFKDDIRVAMEKLINTYCENDDSWPQDVIVPPTLSQHMADAAEVAFDACVAAAAYTHKECA